MYDLEDGSLKTDHHIWRIYVEWLFRDPCHPSGGGATDYILPVSPYLPWPLGHHGQVVYARRAIYSECRGRSVEDSTEGPHHHCPDMEHDFLLQPRSYLPHLWPQHGSNPPDIQSRDEDGRGEHDFFVDYLDHPVQYIKARLPCFDCNTVQCIRDQFRHFNLLVPHPVINLTYIKKNCWNPIGPSIVFPGPRRVWTPAT